MSVVGDSSPRARPVLVRAQRTAVEAGPFHGPSVSGGIPEIVREAGCVDEQFLRHAAPDDAGAADPVLLGEHHLRAVGCRDARGPDTARATADDEEVHVLHVASQIALMAGSAK